MCMRRVACAAIAVGVVAAGSAAAQPIVPDITADILNRAAFATREVRISPNSSVRIEMDRMRVAPAGFVDDRIDVTLTRRWPGAVSFRTERGIEFDVAPHAGLGVGSAGGQAEGGAMLTVSKSREQQALERLRDMGVQDGASFGDKGRWYLFAAASGRAVGLNMLRGENGWDRAGWTTDPTGALVGDAQVGVGWRKGDMQSSFGVIHREVKGKHMVFGQKTHDDTVAAFTFSFRPQK
jgi:hypothetical protein